MRSKVTVNHKRMWAYIAIDICTSTSYSAHQSIWHALITTILFLCQKKKRWIFCRIFGNCTRRSIKSLAIFPRNIWQLQQLHSPRVDHLHATATAWERFHRLRMQFIIHAACQPWIHTISYHPFMHSFFQSFTHSTGGTDTWQLTSRLGC